MRGQVFWRKVHYWMSAGIALPTLLVIASGLLLQVKKDFAWIQPPEQRGTGVPTVSFEKVLSACVAIPEAKVSGWEDITRLDVRPDRGLLKVATEAGVEIQLDASSGAVLQVAERRSDVIEALHDGSWFGSGVKRWVFLPAGVLLAAMWATGMYLFILPQFRKWGKK